MCLNRVSNALYANLPYYLVYFLDFDDHSEFEGQI